MLIKSKKFLVGKLHSHTLSPFIPLHLLHIEEVFIEMANLAKKLMRRPSKMKANISDSALASSNRNSAAPLSCSLLVVGMEGVGKTGMQSHKAFFLTTYSHRAFKVFYLILNLLIAEDMESKYRMKFISGERSLQVQRNSLTCPKIFVPLLYFFHNRNMETHIELKVFKKNEA